MRPVISALVAGGLFGAGLVLAGMTLPERVIGFFDVTDWDPSLALVMAGALLVYAPAFRLILRRKMPYFETRFVLPTRKDVDPRLVLGAAIFGVGWGLGGYCPGPGLVSASAGAPGALVFAMSLFLGMTLFELVQRAQDRRAVDRMEATADGAEATAIGEAPNGA